MTTTKRGQRFVRRDMYRSPLATITGGALLGVLSCPYKQSQALAKTRSVRSERALLRALACRMRASVQPSPSSALARYLEELLPASSAASALGLILRLVRGTAPPPDGGIN